MSASDPKDPRRRGDSLKASRTHRESAVFGSTAGSAGAISQEASGLYKLLVASVVDYAIFALDPDGVILSWTAGAEHLKGDAPHELMGRHFSAFYPAEDIASGKPDEELRVAARDGRVEDEG